MMTMKLKLKKHLWDHDPRLKFNLEKPKDTQLADLFEATTEGKFSAHDLLQENIHNLTGIIHGALNNTDWEVGAKPGRRRNHRCPFDLLEPCDKSKSLKKMRLDNRQPKNQKKEVNENWIADRCKEIDSEITRGYNKRRNRINNRLWSFETAE